MIYKRVHDSQAVLVIQRDLLELPPVLPVLLSIPTDFWFTLVSLLFSYLLLQDQCSRLVCVLWIKAANNDIDFFFCGCRCCILVEKVVIMQVCDMRITKKRCIIEHKILCTVFIINITKIDMQDCDMNKTLYCCIFQ